LNPELFKPGIYEDYKGDRYFALHLAHHHETGELFVVYVCPIHGTISMREWATPGKDSWTDEISVVRETSEDYGMCLRTVAPRFRYLRPAV